MITIGGKNIADISISNKKVIKVQDAETLDIMWEKQSSVGNYFYFQDVSGESNTIKLTKQGPDAPTVTLEYSRDGRNWNTWGSSSTTALSLSLPANSKVYLRGINSVFGNIDENNYFDCTKSYKVGGDITTLLSINGNILNLSGRDFVFYGLFLNSESYNKLVSVSSLTLPSTTLSVGCYLNMFYNCRSLIDVPTLPAMNLADYCYSGMFNSCSSLTTAPVLPATTLAPYCYGDMFYWCINLTTSPILPATTLVERCYTTMFQYCRSLNDVTSYANTINGLSLNSWLDGVSSTGTFHKLGTYNYPSGKNGIPSGWTVVNN